MRHVHLPVEHSDADLLLAGLVAEHLESRALFVTWSPGGYRQPAVETLWRYVDAVVSPAPAAQPAPPASSVPLGPVGTVVAFLAAALKSRTS